MHHTRPAYVSRSSHACHRRVRHTSTLTALAHELGGASGKFKTAVLQGLVALAAPPIRPAGPFAPKPEALLHAGFGNREKDALAYLSSGVPPERVFIIDPSSLIRSRTASTLADAAAAGPTPPAPPPQWVTYAALLPQLDEMFPRRVAEHQFAEAFGAHAAKAAQSISAGAV